VALLDEEGDCAAIPIGQIGLVGLFGAELLPECPDSTTILFDLDLTAEGGFQATLTFEIEVGPWLDDVEADRGWTIGAPGDDAAAGRWIRAEPVGTVYVGDPCQPEYDHTPDPGEICFVTGNGVPGGVAPHSDVDAGRTTLLTPVFHLLAASAASVSYWRWYTNDLGAWANQDYWDVDVTADGTNWIHLEHTTASSAEWTHHTFDLAQYIELTDSVQLRFVAADDQFDSLVEAAVDDFALTATYPNPGAAADPAIPGTSGIVSCGPNPFQPRIRIVYRIAREARVRLSLHDVTGRRVLDLIDGPVERGLHEAALDAAACALPSGVYFLRMRTPEMTQTRQITLLK